MLMLKAFRNRVVSRLWFGQLGSAIGDEIYRVAFVWLAVDLIGSNTGYLASLQQLSVLVFGILGGKWSDRWNPYKTMIRVDLLRALITLTPVVCYYLHYPSFPLLVASSVLIAGLGAFFEPALQTSLPLLCPEKSMLQAANGLMSTTFRLARVMGPAMIGFLSAIIATIHFFTLNAFSFLFSASAVFSIHKKFPEHHHDHVRDEPILKNFMDSLKTLRKHPVLYRMLLSKTITGGAWGLVYGLGIALLIHESHPKDVKAFGLTMSAYGVGNVAAALWFGNRERKNPERMVYIGLAWLGASFIGLGLVQSLPLILLMAALSAIGGPLNDLPAIDLIQSSFPIKDLPKIFRLRMNLENLTSLLFMLASPLLFQWFSIRSVIVGCGIFMSLIGLYGWKKAE